MAICFYIRTRFAIETFIGELEQGLHNNFFKLDSCDNHTNT